MLDFEKEVRDQYAYLLRLSVSILDDPAEAQDAVQEALLHAQRRLHAYRGAAQFKTWLTTIVVNVCRDRLRRGARWQRLQRALQGLLRLREPRPGPESQALAQEERRRIWQAVDELDETQRLVVILRYLHDMKVAEIAVVTGLKEGTVHSRLHHARRRLRYTLGSELAPLEVLDGSR